jgi:hypothetical protein
MIPQIVRAIVELAAAIVLVVGPILLIQYYVSRARNDGSPVGIGLRAIQVIVAVMATPAIIILALEGVISADVIGTLFGGLLGYVLSPKE